MDFFKDKANLEQLRIDNDLNPLRDRADFSA
jgi:hypothetical protein